MSGIICAIRGGTASQSTVTQSIRTAQETGLSLYFVYVVNVDFLMQTAHTRIQTISEELRKLGEFILLTAQTKAEAAGVLAEGVLREGNVAEEIIALSRELAADYVILGRPRRRDHENVFTHDRLSEFSQHIEQETGAKVIFAEEGEA